MPAETSIAMSPDARRDLAESRLPRPLRISFPWPIRRALRINHVTLALRVALGAELIATLVGVWWFAVHGIGWVEFAVFALMFMMSGLGITVGYHRMFAHRSLRSRPAVRPRPAICAALALPAPL